MAKSLENQLKDLKKVTEPTEEQMARIIELEEKIEAKKIKLSEVVESNDETNSTLEEDETKKD
mgnify:CR=1 FL=1